MPSLFRCPSCNALLKVEDSVSAPWLTCPSCLAKVPNPAAGTGRTGGMGGALPASPLPDEEARKDSRLTGFGIFGLIMMATVGLPSLISWGGELGPLGAIGAVLIPVAAVVGFFILRRQESPTAQGAARLIRGTLTMVGVISTLGIVLIVAGVIFLFAVCAMGGGPKF